VPARIDAWLRAGCQARPRAGRPGGLDGAGGVEGGCLRSRAAGQRAPPAGIRAGCLPDLLALKPVEFEHLIRELFEAMGLKSWVTQGSKDDGVDGVAVNEDSIVGGLCIIQAKRWSRIVDVESVHALAGVMDDMNAAKGVLVTTSWVGKASRDFAARNGNRIQIIEGRELKHLLREHLGIDALIGLPKLPPGWEQHDVT
jgi:restriction system protein